MHREPTRLSSAIFLAKVRVLQAQRALRDACNQVSAHKSDARVTTPHLLGESVTALWSDSDPAERMNQCGKVQNLRIAACALNGVVVPAGEVFSFWKQIGRATQRRGFAPGRELRGGCLIPTVGGGLCQMSNALYEAALQAGFQIVERHGHSETIPGSAAARGRDATVFWNYVDLRFRSDNAFRIDVQLTEDQLLVRLWSTQQKTHFAVINVDAHAEEHPHEPNSCMSCGILSCFRFQGAQKQAPYTGRAAYLVDEFWPEHNEYISRAKGDDDMLVLPIDGNKFRKANYAWSTKLFKHVKSFPLFTLYRAFGSRRIAALGAPQQRKYYIEQQMRLADLYAKAIPFDVTHLVVSQGMLPWLWRTGVLGGRTFDVLMTSLPAHEVHARLDEAFARYPESKTLRDFRADEKLLEAEREALKAARKVITPSTWVAKLFAPEKVEKLAWHLPSVTSPQFGTPSKIVFPASTLGRKGAYEVREAAKALGLRITLVGPVLEDANFWNGVDTEQAGASNWLADAALVVLPSWIENQPRRLLQAIAHGVPVVTGEASGLEGMPGVTTVDLNDLHKLRETMAYRTRSQKSSGAAEGARTG